MHFDVNSPTDANRDRLILSKGHGAMALYAALNIAGYISDEEIASFHTPGSTLQVHPQMNIGKGIEHSGGSLGQGLSLGCGIALGMKLNGNIKPRVYVILGDGECDEGSVWEAAAFAAQYSLNNITVIVDYNKLQADGLTEDIISLEPFSDRWRTFGFDTVEVDGHVPTELLHAFTHKSEKPIAVIAHTAKGKGLSFAEGEVAWHEGSISEKLYKTALAELEGVG
jgi:transketolase